MLVQTLVYRKSEALLGASMAGSLSTCCRGR